MDFRSVVRVEAFDGWPYCDIVYHLIIIVIIVICEKLLAHGLLWHDKRPYPYVRNTNLQIILSFIQCDIIILSVVFVSLVMIIVIIVIICVWHRCQNCYIFVFV